MWDWEVDKVEKEIQKVKCSNWEIEKKEGSTYAV